MSALPLIDPSTADQPVADLLASVQRSLGITLNMTKAMASSRTLLSGDLGLSGALAEGVLPVAVREQLALAVSQDNGCSYGLPAHAYLAEHVAHLSADHFADVRAASATDAEIAETIGHVAVTVLTNYVNTAAVVEIDFPLVQA